MTLLGVPTDEVAGHAKTEGHTFPLPFDQVRP